MKISRDELLEAVEKLYSLKEKIPMTDFKMQKEVDEARKMLRSYIGGKSYVPPVRRD